MSERPESRGTSGVNPKEKSGPIEATQISPYEMARFLSDQKPQRELPPRPDFSDIFDFLRQLPPDEQERLLIDFYTKRVQGLPNGEVLGRKLAEVNNISWFQPRDEPNFSHLEKLAEQSFTRLNLPPLSVTFIENDWVRTWGRAQVEGRNESWAMAAYMAWQTARDAARDTIWDTVEATTVDAVRFLARDAAQDAVFPNIKRAVAGGMTSNPILRDVAENVGREVVAYATKDAIQVTEDYVKWSIVEDLMPKRNYPNGDPFEPLIEIYKLGCWPVGRVNPVGSGYRSPKGEFVIFVASAKSS